MVEMACRNHMVPGTGHSSWEEGSGRGQGMMAEHLGEGPPLLGVGTILMTPYCFSFRGFSPPVSSFSDFLSFYFL